MGEDDHRGPGFATLLRRLAQTGLGALHNRGELLAVEWQQERARRVEFLLATVVFIFLALMAAGMLTVLIILLCPEEARLYVAGGFTLVYLGGAVWTGLFLKSMLDQKPFSESLNQLKKDCEWLDSFK
jgi:uncharacterized membrane protein YqjE